MVKHNKQKNNTKLLVTHDGSFHTDDVFACASLELMLEGRGVKTKLVRTRDEDKISEGDFVFDVGRKYLPVMNRFDHHQAGYREKRRNGIPYSSFGLVWKKYGKAIAGSTETAEHIDRMLVEQVDATDNGESLFEPKTKHVFNYDISAVMASFLPAWGEKDSPANFRNAVNFAKSVLRKEIKQFSSLLLIKRMIKKSYAKSRNKRLLVVDADIPRYLVDVASSEYKQILYIVFRDEKNWKMLAVRKRAGTFGNKKDLPKAWAGLEGKELQKLSGVNDAVFCHRGLFLAVAKSKKGILKLAELALKNK